MANSTVLSKPVKPYPDFPLFPHATGRWAKKVRGRFCYFGKVVDDPRGEVALALWNAQKDDLLAGRIARPTRDGLTVRDLCNHFCTAKEQQRDAGDIKPKTFGDYLTSAKLVVDFFGRNRLVDDLRAEDFGALRAKLAKKYGPHGLGREVQQIRTLFKFGYDAGLIDTTMRFGPAFKRPDKRIIRLHRQQSIRKNGKRMFEAAELRMIIDAASQPLKSMILLGINCGFGNHDCATLPQSALNLKTGWVDHPRPKTAVERRCPLWPETVKAIRAWLRRRPVARRREDSDLVFVTQQGARWFKDTADNPVSKEMAKLLRTLKLNRYGVNFYALRHGFETIGGDARDQVAVNAIMGHVDESMADVYREGGVSDDRLRNVVNVVRRWLFPKKKVK